MARRNGRLVWRWCVLLTVGFVLVTTWRLSDSPIRITENVEVAHSATLAIEPGVYVLFEPGTTLVCGGGFVARGTAELPIVFTSAKATPSPGDWLGLYLTEGTYPAMFDEDGNFQSGTTLEHCIVEYAGGGRPDRPGFPPTHDGLLVESCDVYVSSCRIRRNDGNGIRWINARGRIADCVITENTKTGIALGEGYYTLPRTNVSPLVTGYTVAMERNSIAHNASYAIKTYGDSVVVVSYNRIEDNENSGVVLLTSVSRCHGNVIRNNGWKTNTGIVLIRTVVVES